LRLLAKVRVTNSFVPLPQTKISSPIGNILRLRNILSAFDRFAGNEILSPIDFQDYTGTYHDVYDEIKPKPGSKDNPQRY
jgi:hypothetical protein